ncbi:platelet binding protein GspB-like isoform X2 [Hermetia illucens]|uniref:platelet binding protein GspB-like isoform X2 n=1 Tax=Hermetia illucens TaxID=343691 RepID=UPI0018CC425E|nr:platelet binding protein GspB-like isoform X2 [Hermetia illucens]
MAAAAITSTSSSSIQNVAGGNNSVSNSSLVNLGSTSISSSNAGSESAVISSTSASSVISSSSNSSRSRRSSKLSQSNYSDSKSMYSSVNNSSFASSKSSSNQGNTDSHSKSKIGQRKWKDDSVGNSSGTKSRSFKWKLNSDHHTTAPDDEPGSSNKSDVDRRKWKDMDKTKALNTVASLQKMKGLKWTAFSESMGESDEDDIAERTKKKETSERNKVHLYKLKGLRWKSFAADTNSVLAASSDDGETSHQRKNRDKGTVLRLDRSDMDLYGLCPETDPFYAVICDICNAVVKPQGLHKHMLHRHHGSHSNSHHSQHHLHHHRHVLPNYMSNTTSGDRQVTDHHASSSTHVTTSSIASQASSERGTEKSTSKSMPGEASPSLTQSHQTSSSSRAASSSAVHSSPTSSKNKSKSTGKTKSKSSKNGNNASGHSSSTTQSPSPSSASSSSTNFSTSGSRSGASSTATQNGIAMSSPTTVAVSSTSAHQPRSNLSTGQQSNQKQLRTGTNLYSIASGQHFQSSGKSISSKSASSKHIGSGTGEFNNTDNPSLNTATSSNSNSSVSSACSSNSLTGSVTPRRTYGRCKSSSSSTERRTVPIKEREYDANKHCGVISGDSTRPCTRSLTCKAHSLSMRRMVSGRSKSFDKLLADHRATKELPLATKSRAMPELESSNSSSSMDLDRRSVSSNSNLSVEVQVSSTASSQSSVTATGAVESTGVNSKQSTPPPTATTSAISKSNNQPCPSSSRTTSPSLAASYNSNRLAATPMPVDETTDLPTTETVETICMGENDNTIQININRDGTTQSIASVNRRGTQTTTSELRRRSSDEPHRARVTARVIDTSRANVPPELLDDSKFATNIFSPESTVLSGPIRLLDESESAKSSRIEPEADVDMSDMSEERKLQLMVQRKVSKKNKILFRDPNRPSPSAITIPPAAEIVAQAFAEENPTATLTDAQFVMDPETNVVSVSVCGTFNPDNIQFNWAPFNQEFIESTLSQALSPYGITVTSNSSQHPTEQVYGNPSLMPNAEEEGFQIHHLPPLTEEQYNQMRPEFINGMPKPSLLGCPGIKSEIKEEAEDLENSPHQPILPLIKQEGIKDEIKLEIKEEPMEDDNLDDDINQSDVLNVSQSTLRSTTAESVTDTSTVDESIMEEWMGSTSNLPDPTKAFKIVPEIMSQSPEPMSLDLDGSYDGDIEFLQPIASSLSKTSTECLTSINEKENSNCSNEERMRYFTVDDEIYRNENNGSAPNWYYGRLPKPYYVNTFGLVKLRGGTNFRKSILCTRRANSSIHAYQTLFQGGHATFFRRDNCSTLGSKHCTVDSNGAISLSANSSFDASKNMNSNSPGSMRSGCMSTVATSGNAIKGVKQTRRQNSANSPSSQVLKRQPPNFISSASTQTPPSSPFYKRYQSVGSTSKVRLQKRSIIMHFRGNGGGPQHLSKTCAILQSQIVHKLAEQLLGFKKSPKNTDESQSSSVGNYAKGAATKQDHMGINNCKLSSSSSSVSTLMYKSSNSDGHSSLPSSLPADSSPTPTSSPISQSTNTTANPMKIFRSSTTTGGSTNSAHSNSNNVKGTQHLRR